jgi:hypothetical protein
MDEFTGSTIVIPDELELINFSDKEIADHRDKKALFVVYTDSIACATCAIKGMFQYDDIIAFSDSIPDFAPVFIFSPRIIQYTDVKRSLRGSGLNYSALLDSKGMFPAANPHIPADGRFHTFLLDKNGKVVFMGDPITEPRLWNQYKTYIADLTGDFGSL